MTNNSYVRRGGACIVGVLLLGLAACKSTATSSNATVVAQTVTVVGLNTEESLLLSDIYSAALQKSGFRVARRDPVADLAAGYAALNSGAADLFVTSTGQLLAYLAANVAAAASTSTTASPTTTAIATPVGSTTTQAASILPTTTQAPSILATTTTRAATTAGSTAGSTDATATTLDHSSTTTTTLDHGSTTTTISIAGHASAVSINLQTNQIGEILPSNLQIGAAANAEDKPVIVCSAAFANAGNLSTLTDLARVADGLQIAATADFETGNPFGQPGLKAAYGTTFKAFVKVDAGKVAETITSGGADCGAFNSLDVTISPKMVVLDDDKNWIRNEGFIPLMTKAAAGPAVTQVIDQVSQSLTTTKLRALLKQVTVDGVAANLAASSYLQSAGIGGG